MVAISAATNMDHGYNIEVKHDYYPSKYEEINTDDWSSQGADSFAHQDSSDYGHEDEHHVDHHAYPKYKFEYGVKDEKTGDHKSQWEVRDGDVVKGEYTLDEADGTHRIVEYSSDKHNGFNAVVKNIGHAYHH